MYEPKELNVSMAIVAIDRDTNKINETLRHYYDFYTNYKKILITNDLKFDYYNKGQEYDIYHSDSFQVLENYDIALRNCKTEWCFLVQAGTYLTKHLIKKLSIFVLNEKDIIFPVKNRIYEFVKNPLNGLLINKNTYNKVGGFGKDNHLDIIKLSWGYNASIEGCKLKAVVGIKI
jgi:hypothetical protein